MGTALLTASLTRFYEHSAHADVLESIVAGKSDVSLRLVEWYVTSSRPISMDYHSQLKAYTRRLFDPFRRSDRIVLLYQDRSFETTLGQMNFFKWMIEEGYWNALVANKDALNEAMIFQVKTRKATPKVVAAPDPQPVEDPQPVRSKTLAFD